MSYVKMSDRQLIDALHAVNDEIDEANEALSIVGRYETRSWKNKQRAAYSKRRTILRHMERRNLLHKTRN